MKIELTRNGPVLITETYADKVYMEQVMGVGFQYGPHCSGPQPETLVIATDGEAMGKGDWSYIMTYRSPPRCNFGEHLTGEAGQGGCRWAHEQRGETFTNAPK